MKVLCTHELCFFLFSLDIHQNCDLLTSRHLELLDCFYSAETSAFLIAYIAKYVIQLLISIDSPSLHQGKNTSPATAWILHSRSKALCISHDSQTSHLVFDWDRWETESLFPNILPVSSVKGAYWLLAEFLTFFCAARSVHERGPHGLWL